VKALRPLVTLAGLLAAWQALVWLAAPPPYLLPGPLAVAAGWLLARKAFPGKSLFDGVVHLPLVMPPVVVGYLLLLLFGVRGPIGSLLDDWFGIRLVFSSAGASLAAAVMAFPLMVRAVRLAPQRIADEPEHRRPETDEDRPPLCVAALVLIDGLRAHPQTQAQRDRPKRPGVHRGVAQSGAIQEPGDHQGGLLPAQRG